MNGSIRHPLRRLAHHLPSAERARVRYAIGVVRGPFYRGQRRHCPICGGTFRRFLAAPGDGRPDAICPRCGSAERHRLLWLYLQQQTDLLTGTTPQRVLHVAPEPFLARKLSHVRGITYVAGDLAGVGDRFLDVTNLTFPDRSFDVVLCSHVLEHVPDDRRAMREIARVMRGWGIVQVPLHTGPTLEDSTIADPRERFLRFGQEDHVRRYGEDYPQRLRDSGLEVSIETLPQQSRFLEAMRLGLSAREGIFVVRPA